MSVLASIPEVHRARAGFESGRTHPFEHRRGQLDGIIAMLGERERDWAAALRDDLGRADFEVVTGELGPALVEARYARRHLRSWMRADRVHVPAGQWPGRGRVMRVPLGVVAILGPWNYPIYLTVAPLVAAIAAGNAVVIKPSETAPATAALLAELVPRFLDPETVVVALGGPETAERILTAGVEHLFFTGGTAAGNRLRVMAAERGTSVTLELGGKCPAIVAADADLVVAARRIASVALWNAGQTCVRPDHVLVDAAIRDRFVRELVGATRFYAESGTQRVCNELHAQRVASLLHEHGGTVALGGTTDLASLRIEPTIIVDPVPTSPLMSEEIFGPVLPVVTVGSVDDAVRRVAEAPAPLAVYLFTRSAATRQRVIDGTRSGSVVVNEVAYQLGIPRLPFGGTGASGVGAYHGKWGFDSMSQPRAILVRSTRPDLSLRYPPYSSRDQRRIRRLLSMRGTGATNPRDSGVCAALDLVD